MILPAIEISNQKTYLAEGLNTRVDLEDIAGLASRLALAGDIAVIDLDAAGEGSTNEPLVEDLVRKHSCIVGGGICTVADATRWFDLGARKVIVTSQYAEEIAKAFSPKRVIGAVDFKTDADLARIKKLACTVGGVLVTHVDSIRKHTALPGGIIKSIAQAAGTGVDLFFYNTVTQVADVKNIHTQGATAFVSEPLLTGDLHLGDCIAAFLQPQGEDVLWPTVVVDETQKVQGLYWSDQSSLKKAVDTQLGQFKSKSRIKGKMSCPLQLTGKLTRIEVDCNLETLCFTIDTDGSSACDKTNQTCFGKNRGIAELERRLYERKSCAPAGSYTKRLFDDPALLGAKLTEEAGELAAAALKRDIVHEAADVLYFTTVAMVRGGIKMADVEKELDRRSLKVTRRPGNAKPQ